MLGGPLVLERFGPVVLRRCQRPKTLPIILVGKKTQEIGQPSSRSFHEPVGRGKPRNLANKQMLARNAVRRITIPDEVHLARVVAKELCILGTAPPCLNWRADRYVRDRGCFRGPKRVHTLSNAPPPAVVERCVG